MSMTFQRLIFAALLVLGSCAADPVEVTTRAPEPEPVHAMVQPGVAIYEPDVPRATTTTTAPPTTTTTTIPTTTTEPEVQQPAATGDGYGDPGNPATWDRLAECEAWGNWSLDTGNGYYGGLQFSLSSWEAVGGAGYPHQASRETQIAMGQRLWQDGGWSHWPACSRKLGY